MATKASTVTYLLEQMGDAVTAKKMFGEYCLYWDGKVVALVCDDQLFVKPTAAGRAWLGDDVHEAPPYPGAKNAYLVPGERWDDSAWLATLASETARELPAPKAKKLSPKPNPRGAAPPKGRVAAKRKPVG